MTGDKNALKQQNNPTDPTGLELRITAASAQGGRKYMEDRLQVEVVRDENGVFNHLYAAVYDGHGGAQASEYVCANLYNNIVSIRSFHSEEDEQVMSAIRTGFLRTHHNMQKVVDQWPPTASGFPCTAGTTASCVFLRNGKLYTGHIGDSSIVLANFAESDAGLSDAKLTEDHKPESVTERRRIEQAGGAVASKSGITRVVWKRPLRGHRGPVRRSTTTESIPFLAVARALGDFWSLNPDNNEYVVSPDPDVDVFQVKRSDAFLVLASDGLTNVMGTRALVNLLRDLETKKWRAVPGIAIDDEELPLNHAQCVLQAALKKWGQLRADNVSLLCINLNESEVPVGLAPRTIVADDLQMDVGRELTAHPTAMIRVGASATHRLRTNSPELVYYGVVDKSVPTNQHYSLFNMVQMDAAAKDEDSYEGPGYMVPRIRQPIDESSDGDSDVDEDGSFAASSPDDLRPSLADFMAIQQRKFSAYQANQQQAMPPSALRFASASSSNLSGVGTLGLGPVIGAFGSCSSTSRSVLISEYGNNSKVTAPSIVPAPGSLSVFDFLTDNDAGSFLMRKKPFPSLPHASTSLAALPRPSRATPGVKRRYMEEQEYEEEDGPQQFRANPAKRSAPAGILKKSSAADEARPPPPKRNRIWNFFSSIFRF